MPRHPKKPRPPPTPAYTEREARSQRRTMARNPAMTRVLATPELLECVLQHLDMRTLLVSAQCACRVWHELIATSPALQEALFFKPGGLCGRGSAKTRRKKGQGNDVTMPTDETTTTTTTTIDGATADRADDEEKHKKAVVVRKNPLLASVFPAWFEDYTRSPYHDASPGAVLSSVSRVPEWSEFALQPFAAATDRVLRYRRASWRRMLVQQPPARYVGEWRLVDIFDRSTDRHEASM
ncbi:GCR1-dependent translation factor 1 [Pestalotiopsis sp. IQ-011]